MTGTEQKKKSYLLVGNGKLSKHLTYYFQSQNIFIRNWNRKDNDSNDLLTFFEKSDITLLAITDSFIASFIEQNSFLKNKPIIHFSGSLNVENALCFHPLMTFGPELYSIDFYKKIPFIGFSEENLFNSFFPDLENPSNYISLKDKSYYHALCVLSNNFTQILWSKVFREFQERLHLPEEFLIPFLQKTLENILLSHEESATGPLIRKDVLTIKENLNALKNDPYLEVYRSFLKIKMPDYNHKDFI